MLVNNAMVVPPWFGGGQSSNADSFGFQAKQVWQPGETDVRPIIDALANPNGSWRVTVVGDLVISAIWGSLCNRELAEMDAPLIATFPGKTCVYARPRTENGATALVTLAPNWSGEQRDFRRLVTGPIAAIPADFMIYRALTASVLNIRGTVVNVPALATAPLVSGSALTSGTGYLEFTP